MILITQTLDLCSKLTIDKQIAELNREKNAILRCIDNWEPCSELVERTLNAKLDDEWHEQYRTYLEIRGVRYSVSQVVRRLNPEVYQALLEETKHKLILERGDSEDFAWYLRELEKVNNALEKQLKFKSRHFPENNAS